ncbi:MAG: hypothetical protein IJF14_04790 [Clostridia bacterium]|nr:hypothetical protein [Clostridia bacterium]
MVCSFFLGANTPNGFYSLFSELDNYDLSVIKGGSGSGKSTLIRKLIDKTNYSGLCEQILCSSDPDSLDGAVFHSLNSAVVDGTAPHIADVKGFGKYILTPPPVIDMESKRALINTLKSAKTKAYADAYSSLSGYYNALKSIKKLIPFNNKQFEQRADGIIKREAKNKRTQGKLHRRFIDSIAADGIVTLWATVSQLAQKVYVIDDRFGLASGFMENLETGFISNGYEVYSCLSPFDVSSIRHIIIPELSLAFVTSDELSQYKGNIFRNIHISSCVDKKALRGVRQKVRLYEKLADQMLKDAVSSFANARLAHTELENVYRPYLDIDALNKLAEAEKM